MYVFELQFERKAGSKNDDHLESIDLLLAALRMNGQILNDEFSIARKQKVDYAFAFTPESTSLHRQFDNKYVRQARERLNEIGLKLRLVNRGLNPESTPTCKCEKSSWLVLFADYISIDSSIRCGDCFGMVPLYRLRPTEDEEFNGIISWRSDYRACDRLQMNCRTGERFGLTQMSEHSSSLSKQGRELASKLAILNKTPVYYYLYRGTGRSYETERKRKCPGCGGDWLLPDRICRFIDMKCEQCKLVSNIAWNV